jgi:separase
MALYAKLALQYLRLGYTGKAGTIFAQGLKQMKDSEPSASTQMLWHLSYAEYFARIGVISKAKSHVSQAGEVYSRHFNSPKKFMNSSERAERVLAVGRAGFVLSLIEFEENQLEKAIGHIDYAIRVLKTGITAAERATKTVKSGSQDYDPFSSDVKPPVEEVKNNRIQFGSKLWSFKSVCVFFLYELIIDFFHGIIATWYIVNFSRVRKKWRVLVPSSSRCCKEYQL